MIEYIEKYYYIETPKGIFGIAYKNKETAIKVFLEEVDNRLKMNSEYWNKSGNEMYNYIKNGNVKIVEIKKEIKESTSFEILK